MADNGEVAQDCAQLNRVPSMRVSAIVTSGTLSAKLVTLRAINLQTHPNFERIVAISEDELGTFGPDVLEIPIATRRAAATRNRCVARATGELVAFLEAGSVPDSRWLERLVEGYHAMSVAVVGGQIAGETGYRVVSRKGDVKHVAAPLTPFQIPTADPFLCPHPSSISYRRTTLLSEGGFDESQADSEIDANACSRLIDAGYRVTAVDGAIVYSIGLLPSPMGQTATRLEPHQTVGFIHREYLSATDDRSGQFRQIAMRLAAAGVEVHAIVEGESGATIVDEVWIHRIRSRTSGTFPEWAKAAHAQLLALTAVREIATVWVPTANAEGLFALLDDRFRTIAYMVNEPQTELERYAISLAKKIVSPSMRALRAAKRSTDGQPGTRSFERVPFAVTDRATDAAEPKAGIYFVGESNEAAAMRDDLLSEFPTITEADSVATASVVCWVGQAESSATPIVEAMMFGKPIVACAVGVATDYVVDGVTGLLGYPGSTTSLSGLIRRMFSDEPLRSRMGKAARAEYEQRHAPAALTRAAVASMTPRPRNLAA